MTNLQLDSGIEAPMSLAGGLTANARPSREGSPADGMLLAFALGFPFLFKGVSMDDRSISAFTDR